VKLFDSFGATDDDRVRGVNAYQQAHSGGILEPVELPSRVITHSVPFQLWSGLRMHSESPHRACEYRRQTVLKYTGAGSQFVFTGSQTAQGYPGDGSPRDVSLRGIQFDGSPSNTFLPSYDLTKYPAQGPSHVLWMSELHGCSWTNFGKVNASWWDGLSISGVTHFQGIGDTPLWVDAAESSLFGSDAYSFMDNSNWSNTAKPFIRVRARKCTIGKVMITARGFSYQIAIDDGAYNTVLDQVAFDSQDAAPVYGANLRINGGTNTVVSRCSFKGGGQNYLAAYEHGVIEIVGGRQVNISGNNFLRLGTSASPDTPLVFVGPNVPDQGVIVGANNFEGYTGVVRQSRPNQIVCLDPRLRVITG